MSQVSQNIRIRFGKQGDIRFISHLDLMRLFARALRRAQLPVATTQGFNPRPRISLPMALRVGHGGLNEVADIRLSRWVRPEEFQARLQAELPEGIRVRSAEAIAANPNRQPRELSYRVPLQPTHSLTEEKLETLLAQDRAVVTRIRRGQPKEVEIRQFIKALRLKDGALLILFRNTHRGTARPEEVLGALGCREGNDYLKGEIERTHVSLTPLP